MYIKQWLQQPIQKRQCQFIIDEILWELRQQSKIVEKEVESTQTNALGQPMRSYERWYEGADNFYQQLLDYTFDKELEFLFMQYLQTLKTTIVPLDKILAIFGVQSPTIQNMMGADGTIKKGLDNEAACIVFRILQGLVREKYATL